MPSVAATNLCGLLFDERAECNVVFQDQVGNLDVATGRGHIGILDESARVIARCDGGRSSTGVWNVVLELECPRIVQHGLHLADEPVATLENGRDVAAVLALYNNFAH